VTCPMKDVFGISPFSSKREVLNPKVMGNNPEMVLLIYYIETNSVISLSSNLSFTPYFQSVEG